MGRTGIVPRSLPFRRGRSLLAVGVLLGLVLSVPPVAAEPIHFSKLLDFLPGDGVVPGFRRQKPEGTTSSAAGFHTSVVSAGYESAQDPNKKIRVQMSDGVPTQFVTVAYAALAQFSRESTEGYEKGVLLDGFQAVERFTHEGQEGTLTAVVGTVLVEIRTRGLPAETLRTVWKQIPAAALRAAASKAE